MNTIDIDNLIHWLGPNGATSGLEHSNLTVRDLVDLAMRYKIPVNSKNKRSEIIDALVQTKSHVVDKTNEELQAMKYPELKAYFTDKKVSKSELLGILSSFDIVPKYHAKHNLTDFAAREIADIGMFQRIADGRNGSSL
ncbi:hypothetical protein [Candidatus Spongiihabitans sp.]|uniref:hypothetical protein n=1 Tax=Candidatus Spongiihabitans sp. TaxID=3101308 RepID=UPI003C7B0E01